MLLSNQKVHQIIKTTFATYGFYKENSVKYYVNKNVANCSAKT